MTVPSPVRSMRQKLRRKGFDACSLVEATARNRRLTSLPQVPTYWWAIAPNFGDMLMPDLLGAEGAIALRREPRQARLFGVGSILKWLPRDFNGYVWGSGGKSEDEARIEAPCARVVALRGHLSAAANRLSENDVALGDPGLLYSSSTGAPKPHGKVGIIPHMSHKGSQEFTRLADRLGDEAVLIDVTGHPRTVVRAIARCSRVVSSSLHGVIIADSMGIPAAWSLEAGPFEGDEFKYRDYESVVEPVGDRQVLLSEIKTARDAFLCTSTVNANAVTHAQTTLRMALHEILTDPQFDRVSPLKTLLGLPKALR